MNCSGTLQTKLAGKIVTSKKILKVRTVFNVFGSTYIQKYEKQVKKNITGGTYSQKLKLYIS